MTAQTIIGFAPTSPIAYSANLGFELAATGGASGNPVIFVSSTTSVCTVLANKVTVIKAGTCSLAANQAGNATFSAAPQIKTNVVINKAAQAISFAPLDSKVFSASTFTVAATSTSSLAVTFASGSTAVCTVSGSVVKLLAAGNCIINAAQAGNANFNAAAQVKQSFVVEKANQTITFAALAGKALGIAPFTISAKSSANLAVSFSSATMDVCIVTGSSVKLISAGMCSIVASQIGNANFNPANEVTQSFVVGKANQTISFATLGERVLDSTPFDIAAASSSAGLPVLLSSTTKAVCSISGQTISLSASGTCTIAANQAGNANFNAAAQVTRSFAVSKGLAANATPIAVSQNAGQQLSYIFNGVSGQALSLAISNLSTTPVGRSVTLLVTAPDGSTIGSFQTSELESGLSLPLLASSGVHKVVIQAGSSAAKFNLQLQADASGSLIANGAAITLASTTPGRSGWYEFHGEAGQSLGLFLNDNTIVGNTLFSVYMPDGSEWQSAYIYTDSVSAIKLVNLPMTGQYAVRVVPDGTGTGRISIALTAPLIGTVQTNGVASEVSVNPGQQAVFSFHAAKAAAYALSLTGLNTIPADGRPNVTVTDPSGRLVASMTAYSKDSGVALSYLPVDGTYRIALDPGPHSTTVQMQLHADVTGELIANGGPLTLDSAKPAQSASYTFHALAGQNLGLLFSNDNLAGYKTAYVYSPSGELIASSAISAPPGTPFSLALPNLVLDGAYKLRIITDGRGVGQISVALINAVAGNLHPTASPVAITLVPGQRASYTFDGLAGQGYAVSLDSLQTQAVGNPVTVTILDPDAVVISSFIVDAIAGGAAIPKLAINGVYTVLVDTGGNAASFNLRLLPDVGAAIGTNGSAITLVSNPLGQAGSYTFSAVSGQSLGLLLSNNSIAGRTSAAIYRPNGMLWKTPSVLLGENMAMNLANFPESGVYSVRLTPDGSGSGNISMTLTQPVIGSLVTNAAASMFNLKAGELAHLTFDASAGQSLSLQLSHLATTPANGSISIMVLDPDGGFVSSFSSNKANSGLSLPLLTSSGRYKVMVNPGANLAGFSLQLVADNSASLSVNGAAMTLDSATPGKSGSYSFDAVAGQNMGLLFSNNTISGSTQVFVYLPDGNVWQSGSIDWAQTLQIDLLNLPISGKYLVRIVPDGSGVGSIAVALTEINGRLQANGAQVDLQLRAAKLTRLAFSGSKGQALAVSLDALVSTPANQTISVQVLGPDSNTLLSFQASGDKAGMALPLLPVSGTYTLVLDSGVNSASAKLQLLADISGTLNSNSEALIFVSDAPARAGSFTFAADAGSILGLFFSGNTIVGNAQANIYAPDGSLLQTISLATGVDSALNLPNQIVAGNYTVRVMPDGSGVGQMQLMLSAAIQRRLQANTLPIIVNLKPAQQQSFSFDGAAREGLALSLAELASTPNNAPINVSITDPHGNLIANFAANQSTPGLALPLLPVSGSYTATFNAGSSSAHFKLQLVSDAQGLIPFDNTSVSLLSEPAAKAGSYRFPALPRSQLMIRANTIAGNSTLYIYQTNGILWKTLSVPNGSTPTFALKDFPGGGEYTLRVVPDGSGTGSMSLAMLTKKLPTVSLGLDNASPAAPANVLLSASVQADDGVAKVEFFNGASLLAAVSQPPYRFQWNNLVAGTYEVSARVVDSLGEVSAVTASNRITLVVEGADSTAFAVTPSQKAGLAPLQVHFKVQNLLEARARSVRADFYGDGQWGPVVDLATGGMLVANYTQAGQYLPRFEITDQEGNIVIVTQRIQAETLAEAHQNILATFDGMRQMLGNNNINGALQLVGDSAFDKYQEIFTSLGSNLPTAAARLGRLGKGQISDQIAQYVLTRDTANGPVSFLIYFARGEDGIWRIEAM